MTNALIELLRQNPSLFFSLLIIALVLIVLVTYVAVRHIYRGGGFSTPLFKFEPPSGEQTGSPHQEQQQATFQNIINPIGTLSETQLEDVANRVALKVRDIRSAIPNRPPDVLYRPPELPTRIAYIYAVRHDIESKIADIVLKWGGGWAGVSMATFDTFLGHAINFRLIPEELEGEVTDFYFYTQTLLNAGEVSDHAFLVIQYLASSISSQLAVIASRTSLEQAGYTREEGPGAVG